MADAVARKYTEFKYGTELDLQFFRVSPSIPPAPAPSRLLATFSDFILSLPPPYSGVV